MTIVTEYKELKKGDAITSQMALLEPGTGNMVLFWDQKVTIKDFVIGDNSDLIAVSIEEERGSFLKNVFVETEFL